MIKMINVNEIIPHPDNPRRDLGDLSELADSIKESGILQNLTIVPLEVIQDDLNAPKYRVVIGHRRLAAAKKAGLTEVPCSIAEMDHKTQVATMLLENMQRSDLTMYEQAQGFQMMLDLGESLENISERTGFSETTVRRRVKLLELDQDKLKESVLHGVTLMEYMELSKIKDIDKRNEVLDSAGTSNFKWNLSRAIENQEKQEVKDRLIEKVERFATDIDTLDYEKVKTKYLTHLSYTQDSLDKEIEIEEGKEYVYQANHWALEIWENIYGQAESEEERLRREAEEEKRAREAEYKAKVKEVESRTKDLREEFIYSLTNTKLMKHIGDILILATEARTSLYMWESGYIKAFGLDVEEEDFDFGVIEEEMEKRPALSLLKIIYSEDLRNASYFNFRGEHSEDKALDRLYDILTKVGYEMSEEEKQIQDGSHRIFEEIEN